MDYVEFAAPGGGRVLVAVDQVPGVGSGVVTRGGTVEERLHEAQCTFTAALDPIRVVGQEVLDRLSALDRPPDEVRVEFGLEITAKAGAIVSAGGAATMRVALTWRTPSGPAPHSGPGGTAGP